MSPHREAWAEIISCGKELTNRFLLLSNEPATIPAQQGVWNVDFKLPPSLADRGFLWPERPFASLCVQ